MNNDTMRRKSMLTMTAVSALLAATLTACVADPEAERVSSQDQAIQVGKNVEVNPALSHWLRRLELIQVKPALGLETPAITAVSPGTVQRGQTITITGANFKAMTWLGQRFLVDFQASSARSAVAPLSVTSTEITAVVPANATTGKLRLINASNGALWTESALPLVVTLPAPTTGTVRFSNDSQFEVSGLQINGQQLIGGGLVLAPGAALDITGPPGQVPWVANLGFGGTWFTFTGSVTFVSGVTNNQSIPRVTAILALTQGAASATFAGSYHDGNGAPHGVSLVFARAGTWQLFEGTTLLGTGTVVDGAFAPGDSRIAFSVRNASGSLATTIDFPYGLFQLRNGPPSWPIIEYVRR